MTVVKISINFYDTDGAFTNSIDEIVPIALAQEIRGLVENWDNGETLTFKAAKELQKEIVNYKELLIIKNSERMAERSSNEFKAVKKEEVYDTSRAD